MVFEGRVKIEAKRLYELLAMMTIGACLWFIGSYLGFFNVLMQFATDHGLINIMLLCVCVSVGAIVAVARTTVQLSRAIAARAAAEAIADRLARQDPLTGLGNRRQFNERTASMLADLQGGDRLALVLIDLDRFKPVNDIYGHAAGNAVLCVIAERLTQIAPDRGLVARLGGDEFVVLAPGFESEARTGDFAQQVIDLIRRPIPWETGFVEVDATVGVAVGSAGTKDPETLLHAADVAMYEGKRQGRGVWRFFRPEMDEALKARVTMESDLRAAIAGDQIKPYYQPIVALPNSALVGFEVLARWNHPTLGEIAPQTFIPIAEECGLIADLFARVLKAACLDARSWPSHIRLSVNISPQQIQDPQMPEKLLAILSQTRFPARRLEVELTEKALISDIEAARVALASLQNLGVSLALDNFGAGYSILSHLSELRFSKLKIDRSYVSGLSRGADRAMLVDAILQLGANLSLSITAEGIETAEHFEWLSDLGCSHGQGYLFGRAMASNEAEAYIRSSISLEPVLGVARDASAGRRH